MARATTPTPLDQFTTFGELLRVLRLRAGLTQLELSIAVGCSGAQISRLEKNRRPPNLSVLIARFVPALGLADEPETVARLRALAAPDRPERPPAVPNNLPLPLTRFIGREREIADVSGWLARARLVTLVGAGGCGKTRLALEAAGRGQSSYADGAWLVELAPLANPALVPQTVAAALGLRERPGRTIVDSLLEHLRPQVVLLVLDNCEHLIQVCAELAESLLRACPQLTLLATSREALKVPGETVYIVPSLRSPEAGSALSVEAATRYEAVQLFVERSRAALPGFALTDANTPAVAFICRQLDGMPLAIELAAARTRVLRVDQIAARLDDRFRLLQGGHRTALPRHQTLQALIDWSYDLLSPAEQRLLQRLAVFQGGWTLAAAEAVCASEALEAGAVLDLLTQLASKSLVSAARQPGAEARYHLLETIRQYALARLETSGEAEAVRQRHTRYFCVLVETLNAQLNTAGAPNALDQFETERDNFRAALAWIQATRDVAQGPWFADQIWRGLFIRGDWSEARAWLETAVALTNDVPLLQTEARARALGALGYFLEIQGDPATGQWYLAQSLDLSRAMGYRWWTAIVLQLMGIGERDRGQAADARLHLEESLALFREFGERHWVSYVLNSLAGVVIMQGEVDQATALLAESLALGRELGLAEQIGWSLNHLGHVAQLQGEYERATQLQQASLAQFQRLGSQRGLAWGQQSLGEIALAQNDAAAATTRFQEAQQLFHGLGDQVSLTWCLAGLAGAAMLAEEPERAARLWGAAQALRQATGARDAPASRATRERLVAQARAQLGEAAFAAEWAAGQKLTLEQASELALTTVGGSST